MLLWSHLFLQCCPVAGDLDDTILDWCITQRKRRRERKRGGGEREDNLVETKEERSGAIRIFCNLVQRLADKPRLFWLM